MKYQKTADTLTEVHCSPVLTDAGVLCGIRLRGFDDAGGDEFGQQVVDVDLTKVVLWSDDLWSCRDTKTTHH